MEKWEYLTCRFDGTGSIGLTTVVPAENFSAPFPSEKKVFPDNQLIIFEWKSLGKGNFGYHQIFLGYLGSQGWEAYAVADKRIFYFKRKVEAGSEITPANC